MAEKSWLWKTLTESGLVFSGRCVFHGVAAASTDGANSVTVELHDSVDDSGPHPFPVTTIAGTEPVGGGINANALCAAGLYLKITTAGTAEVTVYYTRQ